MIWYLVTGIFGFVLGIWLGKTQWCYRKYGHWNIFRKDVKLWSDKKT